jgi:hypothetical protein
LLLLQVPLQPDPRRVVLVVRPPRLDSLRNERLALHTVPRDRHSNPDPVRDVLDTAGLLLRLNTVGEKGVARGIADVHDSLLGDAGKREELDLVLSENGVEHRLALRVEVFRTDNVDLVDDDEGRLVGEEGLDRLVKLALWEEGGESLFAPQREREGTNLSLHRETALLRQIHEVHNAGAEMSESGDGLHLDGVHLLEGVVENSGSVDNLPAEVLVVHVSNEERLGGKGVRLNVDVGAGDLVDE